MGLLYCSQHSGGNTCFSFVFGMISPKNDPIWARLKFGHVALKKWMLHETYPKSTSPSAQLVHANEDAQCNPTYFFHKKPLNRSSQFVYLFLINAKINFTHCNNKGKLCILQKYNRIRLYYKSNLMFVVILIYASAFMFLCLCVI